MWAECQAVGRVCVHVRTAPVNELGLWNPDSLLPHGREANPSSRRLRSFSSTVDRDRKDERIDAILTTIPIRKINALIVSCLL